MSTFYWANDESCQLQNILKWVFLPLVSPCRYMGIGLSAQGVNMNRLPGESVQWAIASRQTLT